MSELPRTSRAGDMLARGALVFGIVAMLVSLAFGLWHDPRDRVKSAYSDTFSASAIGHRALLELLRELDVPVLVSRYKTDERAHSASLLMIIEPHIVMDPKKRPEEPSNVRFRKMLNAAPSTLVVLPKWDGIASSEGERLWLKRVKRVRRADVQRVLALVGSGLDVRRLGGDTSTIAWQLGDDLKAAGRAPHIAHDAQLLRPSPAIAPIIWCDQGVLLGELRGQGASASGRVFVLSDPDVLANHGLHQKANAALVVDMLSRARASQGGPIVIDEVLHGHRQPPSLAREMTRFPLVLLLIQGVIFAVMLVWAGAVRFGPARREAVEQAPDRAFFLYTTAELLRYGGHAAPMTEAYLWTQIHEVARKLGAPTNEDPQALLTWLVAHATARGIAHPVDLHELVARAEHLSINRRSRARPRELRRMAKTIHRWRKELLLEHD